MAINENACINAIQSALNSSGFKLDEAPKTKEFISIIVSNILKEVKKGTVAVPAQGLSTSQGPVVGNATGTIS